MQLATRLTFMQNPVGQAVHILTVFRVALIPAIVIGVLDSAPWMPAVLFGFMAADLADGMVARTIDDDGPRRRALDSTIDRFAIDACLVAAMAVGKLPPLLLVCFLLRDLYCAIICAPLLLRRGVAIKSDVFYRGLSCGFAAWAVLIPSMSADVRNGLALALFIAALALAVDLTRLARNALSSASVVSGKTLYPSDLRRMPSGDGMRWTRDAVHLRPALTPAPE